MSQLYQRKHRVLISKNGIACLDISQLDVKFNVQKSMGDDGNQGEFTIYNLSPKSIRSYISEGSRIIMEAGYQRAQYGMIFDGDVIDHQKFGEDGVTTVLKISAKDGDIFLNGTFVSQSYAAGMTNQDILNTFVGQGDPNMTLGEITPSLLGTRLLRAKALYGQPGQILDNIAKTESGRFFICDRKINLVKADDPPRGQIVSLTPESGLIGSPEQTETGIKAKCLLNPILNLNKYVHIDSAYIERSLIKVGDTTARSELVGKGIYKIIKISHCGDTGGNDWYTELIGLAQPGMAPVGLSNYTK